MEIATLQTDGISISGPQIDGGYKVTLKTGEYSAEEIAKVLLLPKDKVISVKFYVEEWLNTSVISVNKKQVKDYCMRYPLTPTG